MNGKDEMLIEAYLRGTLSTEDNILIEKRLQDDEFKQKYDEAKVFLQVLKEEDAKKMKSRMQALEKEEAGQERESGNTIKLKIALFAMAIILAGLVYLLMHLSSNDEQAIYASYYTPYPNVVDPIVKGSMDSLSVFQHYELQEYPKVIEQLTSKSALDPDEQFYLAASYLEENDLKNASILFESLSKSAKYADPSKWYLALICIKDNQTKCAALVDSIASDKSNIYYAKAKELLQQIK